MNDDITLHNFQKSILIKEILESGAMLRIKVTGLSMEPFLSSGDIVKIKKVSSGSLLPGDLVFFIDQYKSLVLHRLIKKKNAANGTIRLQTRGDALACCDVPFKADRLLGKVCMIEKRGSARQINLESWQNKTFSFLFALFKRCKSKLKARVLYLLKPGLHV
jgi:signal peptidase I